MNCECIKETEAGLAEHLKKSAGDDVKATCQGRGLAIIGKSMISILNIEFRVTGSKPGYRTAKGKAVSVSVNFCPFCGAPAEQKTAVPA